MNRTGKLYTARFALRGTPTVVLRDATDGYVMMARAPCHRQRHRRERVESHRRPCEHSAIVRKGIVFALASAALFGMSTPFAKLMLGEVPPLLLAGLLYAGSGIGLALLFVGRRAAAPQDAIAFPHRGEWRWLAAAIVFGGVLGPVAMMTGLATSAASTASLLLNLEGAFTALLAWFVFRENFDGRIATGMAAIVAGGVVLVWTRGWNAEISTGSLLVVLACACWAIDNNFTRRISTADATFIAAAKGLAAGVVNLALAMLIGQRLPAVTVLGGAMLLGLLGYGVSLSLFVLALRELGAARASAYFSVAPFFGAALAVILQNDPLTPRLVGGGLLMAAGVWLHVSERHAHPHAHEAMRHTHAHVHDEHHRHSHDQAWDGSEPHTHEHQHAPLTHAHPHYPDAHHRHPHPR